MKDFKEFIAEGTLKKQKAPKHGYIGTHKGVESNLYHMDGYLKSMLLNMLLKR